MPLREYEAESKSAGSIWNTDFWETLDLLIVAEPGPTTLRVTDTLPVVPSTALSSFAPLPSNLSAFKAGLHFSEGLVKFVAVTGPCGWGKTHLLQAIAEQYQKQGHCCAQVMDVHQALAAPGRLETARALLLDDAQEVFGKPKLRQLLRVLLERRMKSSRPTVLAFSGSGPTRQMKLLLPNSRNWSYGAISEPQVLERMIIIGQMATQEGLALSEELVKIVATHMRVNGRTLSGALKRLRLSGEDWTDSRGVLEALGVLNPFFSDNPDWDLLHRIFRSARELNLPNEYALYAMMCIANLPETNVARWADVEPAEAFAITKQFRRKISGNQAANELVSRLVDRVVASLASE
jgi:hypothetical protein